MQKAQTFRGKVVVVTGAASGIGAAICRKFADEGAKIGLMDADEKGAKDMEHLAVWFRSRGFCRKMRCLFGRRMQLLP